MIKPTPDTCTLAEKKEQGLPYSRNVVRLESKEYWITAAEWGGLYGSSFEIGIREKGNRERFELIQGGWGESAVIQAAKAVALMLDAGFSIGSIREVLSHER